jgi:hypothetical protein
MLLFPMSRVKPSPRANRRRDVGGGRLEDPFAGRADQMEMHVARAGSSPASVVLQDNFQKGGEHNTIHYSPSFFLFTIPLSTPKIISIASNN